MQANIVAFGTVFKVASIVVIFGGISALFVKESRRDFTPGHVPQSEPLEI